MNSFYVYLPSNVKDPFNRNTISNYVTKLASTLRLEENWEVALTEICFSKSWYNICKQRVELLNEDGENVLSKNYYFPDGSYSNINEVVTALNHVISDIILDEKLVFDQKPFVVFDKESDKVRLYIGLRSGRKYLPNTAIQLFSIMGFSLKLIENIDFLIDEKNRIYYEGKQTNFIKDAENSGIYHDIDALYIYCNIIKPTYVGDTIAQLLRIVQIPNASYRQNFQIIYDRPNYFPLNSKEINDIEIDIKDDTGESVKFTYGKVRIVLHFKENERV